MQPPAVLRAVILIYPYSEHAVLLAKTAIYPRIMDSYIVRSIFAFMILTEYSVCTEFTRVLSTFPQSGVFWRGSPFEKSSRLCPGAMPTQPSPSTTHDRARNNLIIIPSHQTTDRLVLLSEWGAAVVRLGSRSFPMSTLRIGTFSDPWWPLFSGGGLYQAAVPPPSPLFSLSSPFFPHISDFSPQSFIHQDTVCIHPLFFEPTQPPEYIHTLNSTLPFNSATCSR